MSADIEPIQVLFSRLGSLPELPQSLERLLFAIDSGQSTAIELEKVIGGDPGLSLAILRQANAHPQIGEPAASIRSAVSALGQQRVRNLATSWMKQGLTSNRVIAPTFSLDRYASHSLVTAQAARYLFARRQMNGDLHSNWSANEVFAAALLHDLGIALVACVAPDNYERIHATAEGLQISLNSAFEKIYRKNLNALAAGAIKTWGLPAIFEEVVLYQAEPWLHLEEFDAISCINYADHLACIYGATLEKWLIAPELEFEVKSAVELHADEAARVLHIVGENAAKHLDRRPTEARSPSFKREPGSPYADILVAEDNKVNQHLITLILDHFGHAHRVVSNGREAVDAFAERKPDLVLMDVQMPILDGLMATKEIRSLEQESDERTPIIALTAKAQSNDQAQCLFAGMDDHLSKPVIIEALAEKLAKWLSNKAA